MRRQHKKSRLGCRMCKRRKVKVCSVIHPSFKLELTASRIFAKCDETTPECNKCISFGVPCDYSSSSRPLVLGTSSSVTIKPPRRGRPRSNWKSWVEQINISGPEHTRHPTTPGSCRCDVPRLNVDDLELFYNYLSSSAKTLAGSGDDLLWREGVPQLGFEYPSVLHLMLSLSALQLSRQKPEQVTRYEKLAESHSTTALQAATALMRGLSKEHCPALYITAALICFTSLAQGPSERNMLLVADDGQVPWLSLIRGVKLIVSDMGWSSVFSGVLAKYHPQKSESQKEVETSNPAMTSLGKEDWRASLDKVTELSVILSQQCREVYGREIEALAGHLETTFGAAKDAHEVSGRMDVVMAWIYSVGDGFVERLAHKHPVALIILGHFCVLLRTLENHWFVQGWARHIMAEIIRETDDSCHKWLAWPIQYLG